jgi:hypothetical protein
MTLAGSRRCAITILQPAATTAVAAVAAAEASHRLPASTLRRYTTTTTLQASPYLAALQGAKPPPLLSPNGLVDFHIATTAVYTLPAATYTSPSIFQEEQQHIFAGAWTYIDHASSLPTPGSYTTANIAGEELLLVRDKEDTIRAFYNVCVRCSVLGNIWYSRMALVLTPVCMKLMHACDSRGWY